MTDQRRNLIETHRRVASLVAGPHAQALASQAPAAGAANVPLDAFYARLEDEFRGSRDVVKERARPYLALVDAIGAGMPDAPVVDLGCGRGEWLELLHETDHVAYGIDLNLVFVDECHERGIDARHGDAIAALESAAPGSIGAVTAMHLIEHLPLPVLLRMLDAAMLALRPGGAIVLETPNPENVEVGSHYFYLDPTHRNPVPPALLRVLVEARGFVRIDIRRLDLDRSFHPPALLDADIPGAESINRVIELLRPAPDYAVVGYKR